VFGFVSSPSPVSSYSVDYKFCVTSVALKDLFQPLCMLVFLISLFKMPELINVICFLLSLFI